MLSRIEFKNKYFFGTVAVVSAMILFSIGFFVGKKNDTRGGGNNNEQSKEIRQSGYNFINPLLECEMGGDSPILRSSELEIKKTIQDEVIEKNPDVNISLYYRDLKNGPWFGINEQAGYSPASLLKVPLLIAYYKYAEQDPEIFEKIVLFDKPSPGFFQQVRPKEHIEAGKSYAISQLIESMIKYSDNEATNLLFQNMDPQNLSLVFNDLGINMPDIYDSNNSMSVKDYASFFRILYNASYLNRSMSEKALNLFSTIEYKNGLVAGTPEDILVSHKFGERESFSEDKQVVRQLHDCGIVYHPYRPYLICIMTKGKDFENLSKIVSNISNIVFEQVDRR
ncbi:MAG: serine hydrolase [Parcubacteria group bacterium]|jgi:beta-lactamase class A